MEDVIYNDGTLLVSRSCIVFDQVEYPLDDIDSIGLHVERHYALIRLGFAGGGERIFAPTSRAHAISIADALTKALSGE